MGLNSNEIIYTGVDSLLKLVNSKGKIGISHASKVLNVDQPTVDVWADTLEEMGDLISKYGISERKLMSSDFYHKESSSIKTFLWQINPISKKIIIKKQENKERDILHRKIKEYITLKTQIQAERAKLEREKQTFREMMESERKAFTALKKIYNLKIFDTQEPISTDTQPLKADEMMPEPPEKIATANMFDQVIPDETYSIKQEIPKTIPAENDQNDIPEEWGQIARGLKTGTPTAQMSNPIHSQENIIVNNRNSVFSFDSK